MPSADAQAPAPDPDLDAKPRWRRRPILRAAIRVAVAVTPALAAVVVSIAFSRIVPVPTGWIGVLGWWALFLATVTVTWMFAAELLEKTLPLATLLDLTLDFPDSAPSRFKILRRRIDPQHVEADIRRLRERSDPDSGSRAQLILELAVALSVHDSRTRGHSERVRIYTDLVARELHLHRRDADRLRWAALLHDIGKLAVAPELLNKPDLPDGGELEALRDHPEEGYRLIAPLHAWLGGWAAAVRDHHERFDGTGYPNRLRGRAISLGGRIVAVTDSYETMTAGRPYREALTFVEAREELVRRSGSHFDPYVVRAFLNISMRRLWPVVGFAALIPGLPFLLPFAWRLSQLGLRSASGAAAVGVTAALVVAGVAGPGAGPRISPVHGSLVVAAAPQGQSQATQPSVQPTPPPGGAPPGLVSAIGLPSQSSSPAGSAAPAPSAGGPGPSNQALYPPGVAQRPTLPPGIARQANPFAKWRLHH